jgi:Arc/MetJ family transcription regulator
MGILVPVKTTVEISDALLARAKRHARRVGKPLRALVEEGLRHVLEADATSATYELPDRRVGAPGGTNPLERYSWQDLRDEIYGGR